MATWDEERLKVENEVMGAMADFLRANGIPYKSDIGYLEFPRPMVPEDKFKKIVEKAEAKLKELGYENYNVFETTIIVDFPEQIRWYKATFSSRTQRTELSTSSGGGREWYVYVFPVEEIPVGTVLSGYETHGEALTEAERVRREIPSWKDFIAVFHRSDERIKEYAKTHPAWAKREGFASTSSGEQEVREGDVGTLVESIMAEDTAGRSRRIPAGMEVKVSAVSSRWISFVTGEVIEGENVFVALPLEFGRAFRKRGTRKFRVWFTTPTGFERFVDVEAIDEGEAKRLAEKQVPAGSEFRYVTEISSYIQKTPSSEDERVDEVAIRILELLKEKGPMTKHEISAELGVPPERVGETTDILMGESKIEREPPTGLYKLPSPTHHVCPVCGDPVAGGPDEYLGHIRTKHPEEWRRLETDPSYTLRRAEVREPVGWLYRGWDIRRVEDLYEARKGEAIITGKMIEEVTAEIDRRTGEERFCLRCKRRTPHHEISPNVWRCDICGQEIGVLPTPKVGEVCPYCGSSLIGYNPEKHGYECGKCGSIFSIPAKKEAGVSKRRSVEKTREALPW